MRTLVGLFLLALMTAFAGEAAADPVVLSGFDAEENGGKSGNNNNNGWQFLQSMFFKLGTMTTNTRLVVLRDSLPTDLSKHTEDTGREAAILNAFVWTKGANPDANGDFPTHESESFLGQTPGWSLSFVSDVKGLLDGGAVESKTTSFTDNGDKGHFEPYANVATSLGDVGILYVPSQSGVAALLDNPGLTAFIASGGILFVGGGADNYGDWLARVGLASGNVGAGDGTADIMQGSWSDQTPLGALFNVRANDKNIFSLIDHTSEDAEDEKLPYGNSFAGFDPGGYSILGSFNPTFAIFRNNAATSAPVPEPGSIALAGAGVAVLLLLRRRRTRPINSRQRIS